MIRTFIAIDLPPELRQVLQETCAQLRTLGLEGRPVPAEAIHLTLKFLGPVEERRAAGVGDALQEAAEQSPGFDLRIARMGVFPHLANPRVIWAGVEAVQELLELQRKIEQAVQALGFEPEKRDFRPHLTLLRLKSRHNLKELVRFLQGEAATRAFGEIQVTEVHLYQSILKPQGAEYRKLRTVKLKQARKGPPSGG